jgi:hypothetical protein
MGNGKCRVEVCCGPHAHRPLEKSQTLDTTGVLVTIALQKPCSVPDMGMHARRGGKMIFKRAGRAKHEPTLSALSLLVVHVGQQAN